MCASAGRRLPARCGGRGLRHGFIYVFGVFWAHFCRSQKRRSRGRPRNGVAVAGGLYRSWRNRTRFRRLYAATPRLRCGGRCYAACALRRPRPAIKPREARSPPAKNALSATICFASLANSASIACAGAGLLPAMY
ncbi:MAG: hypothetical protein Pg6A_11550 [Termitinemataceae bacterium]|nr:MAG: hypothetical protein Pg6A_11550 [Termitinemataceae bacterium]